MPELVAFNIRIPRLALQTADDLAPTFAANLATAHLDTRSAVLREAVIVGLLELERQARELPNAPRRPRGRPKGARARDAASGRARPAEGQE